MRHASAGSGAGVAGSEAEGSTVAVLNGKGEPENGEAGKRITALLLEDLK